VTDIQARPKSSLKLYTYSSDRHQIWHKSTLFHSEHNIVIYLNQPWNTEWRRNFGKNRTSGVAILQSWKCSARLQKSVWNWKEDKHFTVVCSAHCKAWSSAENLLRFDRWRHFILESRL